MLPPQLDVCLMDHRDVIFHNLLPKLSLTDLKIFSSLNKDCFSMYQKILENACQSKEIYKMKLRDGKLPIFHIQEFSKKHPEIKLCTAQSSIGKTNLFYHYNYHTYLTAEMKISVCTLTRFNLKSNSIENMELPPKTANTIEEIVSVDNSTYVICSIKDIHSVITSKSILLPPSIETTNKINKKNKPFFKEIPVSVENHFLEVYKDKVYTGHGKDSIQAYDGKTGMLISTLKCEDAHLVNKIVGIQIDSGCLYVRLSEGTIHIYDLESPNHPRIHTIKGPDCMHSQVHFEVRNDYLYTASDFSVTQWKITDKGIVMSDQIELPEPMIQKAHSQDFNFQIDGDIIYLGVSKTSILQAYEIINFSGNDEKFNYLADVNELVKNPEKEEIEEWHVKEGVIFSTLRHKQKGTFRSQIINLNPEIRKLFDVKGESEVVAIPKKETFTRKLVRTVSNVFHKDK